MDGYTAGVMQDRWSLLEICSTSDGFRPCPELLDQVEGSSVALAVPPMSCVVHTGRAYGSCIRVVRQQEGVGSVVGTLWTGGLHCG
jgi:hypothetical protein